MKKRFLVMAMAGLALAGCVSEDVNEFTQKKEKAMLGFDTPVLYSNVNSRANFKGEIESHSYTVNGVTRTYSYPQEENFIVYAVSHTAPFAGWANSTNSNFFNDNGYISVAYEGTKFDAWVPKNGEAYYYWPDNKYLSFAATSPSDINTGATRTYGPQGLEIENFEVASQPKEQYDLLFGQRVVNQTARNMNTTDPNQYSGINIHFQHALSSIHFAIMKDNNVSSEIELKKLTLQNVKDKGDFFENIVENSADYTQYVIGTSGNVHPTWNVKEPTSNDDTGSYTENYTPFNGSAIFPFTARGVTELLEGDISETNYSYPLLLLPQTLTNDVVLSIEYMVGSETKTKTVQLNQFPEGSPITTWEMGKRYTYVLHYSIDAAKKDIIFFAPTTESWVNVESIQITL